jgi:hypothetical protein
MTTARRPAGGPKSLAEVVAEDDAMASLAALRDLLARQLDVTRSSRDIAALSRRLLEVLARIEALRPYRTVRVDQIAAKRAARRQAAALRQSAGSAADTTGDERGER